MLALRIAGFTALLLAAGFVWIRLGPTVSTPTSYESLVSAALSDAEVNNLGAAGAPQQAVVNGWVARDLLAIIAREQADALAQSGGDTRIPALLLVGVLALIWHGLTLPGVAALAPLAAVRPRGQRAASATEVAPSALQAGQRVRVRYKDKSHYSGVRGEVIAVGLEDMKVRSEKSGKEVSVRFDNIEEHAVLSQPE